MDATDRALIDALRTNARASWAELGRIVGMSGPSVTDRVQRLEQTGVITGYHAAVEPSAIGLPVAALVGVHLTDTSDQDAVAVALSTLEEVEDCWFVAGDEAFLLKVRVADVIVAGTHPVAAAQDPRGCPHPHDGRALDQVGEPDLPIP